jgi:hypothetical protein
VAGCGPGAAGAALLFGYHLQHCIVRGGKPMSSVPEANVYAPPTAHVEDIAPAAATGQLGGHGARLGAALIDATLASLDTLLIFPESRRCLHDNIADTFVVVA